MSRLVTIAAIAKKRDKHRDTIKKHLDNAGILPVDVEGPALYDEAEVDAMYAKRRQPGAKEGKQPADDRQVAA